MTTQNTKIEDSINAEIIKNLGHFECGANKKVFELVKQAQDLLIEADVAHQLDVIDTEILLNETAPTTQETEQAIIKRELELKNAKVRNYSAEKEIHALNTAHFMVDMYNEFHIPMIATRL